MAQERPQMPQDRLFEPHDVAIAFAMSTRLPILTDHARAAKRVAAAAWAAPLVGVAIGAAAAAFFALLSVCGLPTGFAAWTAVGAQLLLTGALHEDGLADSADGLGAGGDPGHIRDIMRDSRIGVFGAAALIVALGARASAVGAFVSVWDVFAALIAAGAVSRAIMALIWTFAPIAAGEDGLAARAGAPKPEQAYLAAGLGLLASVWAILATNGGAAVGIALATLLAGGFALYARRRVGALTGDLFGAAQLIGEITILGACAASA